MKDTKRCPQCGEMKPFIAFAKNKSEKSGLQSNCRECAARRYRANKERRSRTHREKYNAHEEFYWRARLRTAGSVQIAKAFHQKYLADPHCIYCRVGLTPDEVHIDHLIPKGRGGKHEIENLAVSCADCNHLKHDRTPEEFAAFLQQYLSRFSGNEAEAASIAGRHRERLSESASIQEDATVRSHENKNHERLAEMTSPTVH